MTRMFVWWASREPRQAQPVLVCGAHHWWLYCWLTGTAASARGCVALGEESTRGHYRNFGCSPLLALPPLQCHTHFVHEFGRRVSMAYGANGSGKSALLQARADASMGWLAVQLPQTLRVGQRAGCDSAAAAPLRWRLPHAPATHLLNVCTCTPPPPTRRGCSAAWACGQLTRGGTRR